MSKETMRRVKGAMFKLPMMITCEAFEDFIVAYLDNDVTPKQKFIFEVHLKLCKECRDYLRAYRTAMELARRGAKEVETVFPVDVPENLVKAVVEARNA